MGSSFALTGGSRETGFASLWGRGAVSSFDGREGELTLDGEVQSAMVGADWVLGATTAGVMASDSRGESDYRSRGGGGDVESTLTGLYPYGRHAVSDRLSLWGVVGYAEGSLTLTPKGQVPMETDVDLTLACAGLRSVMVEAPAEGGLELAANSDRFVVRTSSDRARGLAAANAEVARLRLALEGAWRGGQLVPSKETCHSGRARASVAPACQTATKAVPGRTRMQVVPEHDEHTQKGKTEMKIVLAALLLSVSALAHGADLWWAVSLDYSRHAYGAAWKASSRSQAEQAAINGCMRRSDTGENCEDVASSGKNSCFYIVSWMTNEGRIYDYGGINRDGDPLRTKRDAMKNYRFHHRPGETLELMECASDR